MVRVNLGGMNPTTLNAPTAAAKLPTDEAPPLLQEQVVELLRERILSGELAPGHRLVERALAAELGVSRLPIRDALNVLRGEGFVTSLANRSVIVTPFTAEDIEELFEVREALEMLAVSNAAERATPEELDLLDESLEATRAAYATGDARAVAKCDQDFHDLLWKLAHNSLLISMMEPLEGRLHWLLRQHNDPQLLLSDHVALVNAIRSGDVEEAKFRARKHVCTSRRVWLAIEGMENEPRSVLLRR